MAANAINVVIDRLRRAVLRGRGPGPSDGKLLECFIEDRDEAAFEALVRRHGPMVLGVCLRVLGHQQDAEDAFQATFLVLVRKAASVAPREMVGNWLYGVAQQTAVRMRVLNAKRLWRERQVAVIPEQPAVTRDQTDWRPLLDQELSRLPANYRAAVILCDLEGRTRKSVAQQLGWAEGSVSSRLARGRALLAKRLARRGVVLSAEALAVLASAQAASASVPAALTAAAVKAAILISAGPAAAAGLISTKVAVITEGVLASMFMTKLKTVAVTSIVVCALGIGLGASYLAGQSPGEGRPTERKSAETAKGPPKFDNRISEEELKIKELKLRITELEERLKKIQSSDPSAPTKQASPRDPFEGSIGRRPDPLDGKGPPTNESNRAESPEKSKGGPGGKGGKGKGGFPRKEEPSSAESRLDKLEAKVEKLIEVTNVLIADLKDRAPSASAAGFDKKGEMRIFALRHLEITEAADVVEKFFNQAGSQKKLVVATLNRTNSLIVQGTPAALDEVAVLISRLESLAQEQNRADDRRGKKE
jgi:RNA polymerase sigma factor (sigma-70 family)